MAERVQLRRTKGYRKPEGAVVVARPSRWGNPWPIAGDWIMWTAVGLGYRGDAAGRRDASVALYRAWLTNEPVVLGPAAGSTEALGDGGYLEFADGTVRSFTDQVHGIARAAARLYDQPSVVAPPTDLDELRGRDLACWCPLDKPCHGDVLLEVANR